MFERLVKPLSYKYTIMPRLSLYKPNRTNDYRYIDRIISEQYTVGGLDLHVHKYLGPKAKPDAPEGEGDATQPVYAETNPFQLEDLLLGEIRDRSYDPDVYIMRGVYNAQDVDFDLSQFGLFLNNDTVFITFHYNDMIDTLQRKLMSGDVIEFPNLKDWHPLDPTQPPSPRFYVVQDASFASEGFSQTWLPHLWRVKATPLTNTQEYQDIVDRVHVSGTVWDPDNYYPGGSVVQVGDEWYQATQNVPPGTDITDTDYWELSAMPTLGDSVGTRKKDLEVNQALLAQAQAELPLSGYDTSKFFVYPVNEDGTPAHPSTSPANRGWTLEYLSSDGIPPNGFPVTPGVNFPANPTVGDFALRLDYWPNRLFRFNGARWVKFEDNVKTHLINSPTNDTQRSTFVNNTYTVNTKDQGAIPSRQSLSDMLRPTADNGNAGGNKTPNPWPATAPGAPAS